jgi:hypothetical protein
MENMFRNQLFPGINISAAKYLPVRFLEKPAYHSIQYEQHVF